jgi:hypothetical protein
MGRWVEIVSQGFGVWGVGIWLPDTLGLKPAVFQMAYAALKGPLFHGAPLI